MKKLLYLVFMGAAVTAFGQTTKKNLVVANGMIANDAHFKASSILSKKVISNQSALPQDLALFGSILDNSTITVLKIKDSDFTDDRISLKDLNTQFEINEASPVMVDDVLVNNGDIMILGGALAHMETKLIDGKKILHITTKFK